MAVKKITRPFITHHNQIIMTQFLPTGRKVWVEWVRSDKNKWLPIYKTDSAYHICPYTGLFGACAFCDAYNDDAKIMEKNCWTRWEREWIDDNEMASRATACANATGCTIDFRSIDG